MRRAFLQLIPAFLATRLLPAQAPGPPLSPGEEPRDDGRLPNGKNQQDEILKVEYQRNLKEARDLIELAKAFELDLEKGDRFVLSVSTLKKLDDMEKAIKRIRGRLKHY